MAPSGPPAPRLDRRLGGIEYFTLGFGTMVGAGWLLVIDDFLRRGGPAGGALGFTLGALLLLPIGLTYGRLVAARPDAGGEVAYAEHVFPAGVTFATGWLVVLAYLVVCPWEAVAIGKLVSRVVPGLDSAPLYELGGQRVFLPRLVVGLALAAGIGLLNYRGIRLSAAFQNFCTFGLLAVFASFTILGLFKGSASNLTPVFAQPGLGGAMASVVLILQIVPYYMTGFESVAKSSEEAKVGFGGRGFTKAILAAIAAGAVFYSAVLLVVPYVHPWPALTQIPFGTAVAFERAFGSRVIGDVILLGAVLSLFKVWNGCFVAATRLLYGMARRGMLHPALARVHARFLTPHGAIAFVTAWTVVGALLGDAALVPISEVGSLAIAAGWLVACASFLKGVSWAEAPPSRRAILTAKLGALVAAGMVLMKLVPFVPGHMSATEAACLAAWMVLGWALRPPGVAGRPLKEGVGDDGAA
jgi:basic amino acid/polyamine antiporter, APA family